MLNPSFWIQLASLSLVLAFEFFFKPLFFPLDPYFVAQHEVFHALSSYLTGGYTLAIEMTFTEGETSTVDGYFPIIASAGYLGSALWGGLLIRWSHSKWMNLCFGIMTSLVIVMMLVKAAWGEAMLTATFMHALSLCFMHRKIYPWALTVLGYLWLATCFDDIVTYLWDIPGQTDAGILARDWGMPALTMPISIGFALISLSIWAVVFYQITHTFVAKFSLKTGAFKTPPRKSTPEN